MPLIIIDPKACDGCGLCVTVCPTSVLELSNKKVRAANPQACLGVKAKPSCVECTEKMEVCDGCVVCVRSCPTKAITIQ